MLGEPGGYDQTIRNFAGYTASWLKVRAAWCQVALQHCLGLPWRNACSWWLPRDPSSTTLTRRRMPRLFHCSNATTFSPTAQTCCPGCNSSPLGAALPVRAAQAQRARG